MDRILNMILRRAIGRVVNKGVDAGIDMATRGRNGAAPNQQQRGQAKGAVRQARGAMRMFRRIGRM
ncbi:hypothetical protein A8B78_14975 [Jannaschia sp. EhC01]|uniref:Uncharacterized protein n=1 Tax=Gymnodinialimonas phycosphaerae TaxID=2841589 RepID=A0A975TV87_9RHOB|nr:hypothetical protein [Gymnodinialimonas phycosphaerae]MBY4891372.1 hypothetical protein [Gymnodinialimonas phycosphaerae]OAN76793.1 hypothetical protein A8B78_14975 [Jannaschia sp. EhC01]